MIEKRIEQYNQEISETERRRNISKEIFNKSIDLLKEHGKNKRDLAFTYKALEYQFDPERPEIKIAIQAGSDLAKAGTVDIKLWGFGSRRNDPARLRVHPNGYYFGSGMAGMNFGQGDNGITYQYLFIDAVNRVQKDLSPTNSQQAD